ncbi:DUF3426 domain-containing protein [Ramlibacter terrae]|uniref:DUF3426 domain-containing protein n=1 Tax=Ramlibacter terrae TaxID=2732511 RepID=A0ABX6P6V1_9BURK|nr:DUF3426 domain-containing protein [Ramlibacter terrae]
MSLITSCPACGTMFRVVPDQLKISEGWVRCGHCAEVFDASAHLDDEAALAPVPPSASAAGATDDPVRGWESTAAAPLASVPAPLLPTPAEPPPAPAPASNSRFGPDSQSLEPSSLDAPFVFRRSDFDHSALPSVLPPAPDSRLQEEPDDDDATAPALEQVSFVRDARRKAVWRRPLVRLALTFFGLLLAAALALQLAYHERDRLAALQPDLRPLLVQMCGYLDCRLAHPRQIEAIVIDSSGFNRMRGDTYRLTFNARNTAPTRVATPSLELTLTDSQDQPLLRRVLSPQELGANDGFIPAASEWSGAAGVVVSPTSGVRVSGYRLLAFYP